MSDNNEETTPPVDDSSNKKKLPFRERLKAAQEAERQKHTGPEAEMKTVEMLSHMHAALHRKTDLNTIFDKKRIRGFLDAMTGSPSVDDSGNCTWCGKPVANGEENA